MKSTKIFLLIIGVFCAESVLPQQSGKLFLSSETLKKYAYPYEVDQSSNEYDYPERFSNSGWKYHAGDDLKWKEVSYNDSDWNIYQTDFKLDSIPQGMWQGIGWFRLKLVIDSSLYNQVIALVMNHYGASEIYLDGKLINQYGTPDKNPDVEKTLRPLFAQPVMLSLDNKPEHLLAIRYSFTQASVFYNKYGMLWHIIKPVGFAGFSVHFGDSKDAVNLYNESLRKNLFVTIACVSILLLMGVFHLFLFWFHSRERSNLFIGLFIFILAGHCFCKFLPTYTHLGLGTMIFREVLHILFGSLWLPGMMVAYYSVFYKKLPKYIWFYLIWIPVWFYMNIYNFSSGFVLAYCFVVFFDMMRLFISSVRRKQQFTWLIGIGVLISQSALILYFSPISKSSSDELLILYIIYLAVPVAMSIFNSMRTARVTQNLEKQLDEVERLSELTLTQQQEKQQILASQNEMLEHQVSERTIELKKSLEDLKSTQSQLIQSEKMASLGELTAGIAHEIQNPLNFVNNFSEVNTELIDEMQQQIDKGNYFDAKATSNNIKENELKINHHGKRADAIVKGMLQHSRESKGLKEPTDINVLADEYLRLSYYGFRAKDKSFNATIITDFDSTIGRITIIPQDIGRVLLNLYNNAFYAISEKAKRQIQSYEPKISVVTKRNGNKVEIMVKDNGAGIAQKVVDKIFQPFFTTKPAGQGTGLGLSLSYDIIKAHGGELKVESQEGKGAEFVFNVPVV
jgi:two-component system, NtrC family, sensor kinase